MTLNEIVFDIKELLQVNSDDKSFDFSEDYILYLYEEFRSLTITKLYNRSGRIVDSQLYQTMILELEQVDRSFCPLVPIKCKIVRTKKQMPSEFLYNHRHAMVDRVGGNDILSKKYKFIEYSSLEHVFGGSHAHKYIYVFELGGYLYLTSVNKMVNALGNIVVRALFENPSKIIEAGACFGDCSQYPTSLKIHSMAKEGVMSQLINKYQIPKDKSNNADSDITQMSRPNEKS